MFVLLALVVVLGAIEVRRSAERSERTARRAVEQRAVERMGGDLDELLATASQLRRSTDLFGVVAARSRFPVLAKQTIALPVATSVALEQVVPAGQRRRFEREGGLPIDRVRRASLRLPSLVVTSAVSTQVAGTSLWGLDVFVDPQRRRVLREAFAAGAPRATPPVSGLRRARTGLTVYLPLRRRSGMPMPDVVAVSLDVEELGDQLRASLPAGTEVAIRAGGRTLVKTDDRALTGTSRSFSFAGRQWQLVASAPMARGSHLWLAVLVGGLVLAALLAGLAWWIASRMRRAADEQHALVQRIGDLFSHSPLGLIATDADHRVIEVNGALEELLGTPAVDLLHRPVTDLVDESDRSSVRLIGELLSAGRTAVLSGEVRLLRRDGSAIWTQLTATPQRAPDGRLSGLLLQADDIERRRSEAADLKRLAERDPLTGALNRRSFDLRLERHLATSAGPEAQGALMMIDLDRFKQINDVHGHGVGDEILIAVAQALQGCLRDEDALGRLGGDEFAVLLANGAQAEHFEAVADRLHEALVDLEVDAGGRPIPVAASIGWAACGDGELLSARQVMDAADAAMYRAKPGGHPVRSRSGA